MAATFGYTIFYVDDVDATLRFFTDAFGIARKFITPEGDYGELATGVTVLSFASTELASANLADAGGFTAVASAEPPVGASVTLVTDDVGEAVASAVKHGAVLYSPVAVKPWGQTVAYVRDPNGILVEVATAIGS